MQKILIIGAGRSSTYLIEYLLKISQAENWLITLADSNFQLATGKINGYPNGNAVELDIDNEDLRHSLINTSDIVVSMLPAHMHMNVAKDCILFGKHLVTASYVSEAMRELHDSAKQKNILLLNEIGLDPGIDHMSAMKIIHQLKIDGAKINSFKSYCGGLVAPESADNPWGYKFSWNPRNVILAGQNTAQYLDGGTLKYIPYQRIFSTADKIHVEGLGDFDAYANRDSLSYIEPYDLIGVETMLRGTLRQHPYCKAWNIFVQLGLCDDSYKINASSISYRMFVDSFLPTLNISVEEKLKIYCGADDFSLKLIEFTGILNNDIVGLKDVSPAEILQQLLEKKWKLNETDKDMIVMVHQFEYVLNGKPKKLQSSLVVKGKDNKYTAMAMTVGLPAAIAVKLILNEKIKLRGVQIPIMPELYEPILRELSSLGISFVEKDAFSEN